MKLSTIKNRIKESIKQLTNEQAIQVPNALIVASCDCVNWQNWNGTTGVTHTQIYNQNIVYNQNNNAGSIPSGCNVGNSYAGTGMGGFGNTIDGQVPQVGDKFECDAGFGQFTCNWSTSGCVVVLYTSTTMMPSNVNLISGNCDSNSACLGSQPIDYGWRCKDTWPEKPGVGMKCVPGNVNNPGPFSTKQDCLASGCEPLPADKDLEKNLTPGITTDPQSQIADPEIDRMKDLANIK